MPLKILSYVKSIADKDAALKSSLEKVHSLHESSDYIVLLVPTKVEGSSIMVKETSVLLPWASRKKENEYTEHCLCSTHGTQRTGSAQYADQQSARAAEGDAADGRAV